MGRPTLDNLFRTRMAVKLGDETLYLRVLSDADIQARDEHATRAMAQKRKALATPGSPEYETFVAGLDLESDESLRGAILLVDRMAFVRESQSETAHPELQPRLYPFPDNATDDEKAETLEKREEESKRIAELRKNWIEGQAKKREAELTDVDHKTLVYFTQERQRDAQGRSVYSKTYVAYTLYAATFRDEACKERLFESVASVGDLPSEIRDFLADQYFSKLDIIQGEHLKYFLSTGTAKESVVSQENPEKLGGSPISA